MDINQVALDPFGIEDATTYVAAQVLSAQEATATVTAQEVSRPAPSESHCTQPDAIPYQEASE